MSDEFEAAGTIIEGGLVAKALDDEGRSVHGEGEPAGGCLNCKAPVNGNFCGNCGQPLHIHRSIGAFWHDILHGVLHFEGKFWRTLPLLAWKPGELTRRYVHGERAKFISPMALFLFSVFMMFAVFSLIGSPFDSGETEDGNYVRDIVAESSKLEDKIQAKTTELANSGLDTATRERLEKDILNHKRARNAMSLMTAGEMPYPEVGMNDSTDGLQVDGDINLGPGWENHWLSRAVMNGIKKVNANPDLLLYKLKANGYKFAWLLIPISLPFVWLTLIGRRGFHFYDHAVFATYSISFMSLLFITGAVLAALGVPGAVLTILLVFYPPLHMYRQLRHAYQMTRAEALVRVSFLLVFTVISLFLFFAILLALGVLG